MDLKDYLTNENIRKKFNSQFDLVNYAIRLAANMIMTGRDSRIKIDSQNRAMQVLNEILNDKDQFDEIIINYEEPTSAFRDQGQERQFNRHDEDDEDEQPAPKAKERKKPRKILMD